MALDSAVTKLLIDRVRIQLASPSIVTTPDLCASLKEMRVLAKQAEQVADDAREISHQLMTLLEKRAKGEASSPAHHVAV